MEIDPIYDRHPSVPFSSACYTLIVTDTRILEGREGREGRGEYKEMEEKRTILELNKMINLN